MVHLDTGLRQSRLGSYEEWLQSGEPGKPTAPVAEGDVDYVQAIIRNFLICPADTEKEHLAHWVHHATGTKLRVNTAAELDELLKSAYLLRKSTALLALGDRRVGHGLVANDPLLHF